MGGGCGSGRVPSRETGLEWRHRSHHGDWGGVYAGQTLCGGWCRGYSGSPDKDLRDFPCPFTACRIAALPPIAFFQSLQSLPSAELHTVLLPVLTLSSPEEVSSE